MAAHFEPYVTLSGCRRSLLIRLARPRVAKSLRTPQSDGLRFADILVIGMVHQVPVFWRMQESDSVRLPKFTLPDLPDDVQCNLPAAAHCTVLEDRLLEINCILARTIVIAVIVLLAMVAQDSNDLERCCVEAAVVSSRVERSGSEQSWNRLAQLCNFVCSANSLIKKYTNNDKISSVDDASHSISLHPTLAQMNLLDLHLFVCSQLARTTARRAQQHSGRGGSEKWGLGQSKGSRVWSPGTMNFQSRRTTGM